MTIEGKRQSWFRLESTPANTTKMVEPKEPAPRTLFGQLSQITNNITMVMHETGARGQR